jgi:3-hydroxyisobutyrate dehydrogenase-like beta-hydroxyacid dehydrogenase
MTSQAYNVAVIGIGAMGGGMARALLDCPLVKEVHVYDHATVLVDAFYEDAKALNKAPPYKPSNLSQAVYSRDFVLIVLQNEPQCETVCFGQDKCLLSILKAGVCVMLSSTVTATWSKKAAERFAAKGILFVDCPMSGGPARARTGDLTVMASGDEASLTKAKDILDAVGSQVYLIQGGAGMGSTAKMV